MAPKNDPVLDAEDMGEVRLLLGMILKELGCRDPIFAASTPA